MDITLKTSEGFFNYRVGAIIIHENKLLAVKNDNAPFYYSIGGRVKFGESSNETILREVYEETGIHFEIERLAFIHENFFASSSFAENSNFHEIALFYLMKYNDSAVNIKTGVPSADGGKTTLHWLPVDSLSALEIYPAFFKSHLQSIGDKPLHFVTKNEKTYIVNS